jgi:hypothetical protein
MQQTNNMLSVLLLKIIALNNCHDYRSKFINVLKRS